MVRASDEWGGRPDPPAVLGTPWATTLHRGEDGLHREAESGRAATYWAWLDSFARHHETGARAGRARPGGLLYLRVGDEVGLLWPGWSAGVMPVAGGPGGSSLLSSVAFDVARRKVEEWWMARQVELADAVDVDALVAS